MREGNVFSLFTPRAGGTLARSRWGGTPARSDGDTPAGGTPPWVPPSQTWQGGTPHQVPLSDLTRGVPHLGYPSVGPGEQGTLTRGYPHLGYPPSDLASGTPDGGYLTLYRITDGVPDTPRSRRKTFLFDQIFHENCIKMKEIRPRGDAP